MIAGFIFVVVWLIVVMAWPCKFGMHKWDMPGGHCEDCGTCDDFFGPHEHVGGDK